MARFALRGKHLISGWDKTSQMDFIFDESYTVLKDIEKLRYKPGKTARTLSAG
jgi:hypothetical protein